MKEVTGSYNPRELEAGVQDTWKRENTYARVQEVRKDGKAFFFVDGPPYTTGHIHLGTAWNKIIKDTILRYHRMGGRNIIERAGYDMHGLPIEVKVEHQLGFTSKKDIEDYGIAAFIEQCRTFAVTHMEIMSEQFRQLGIWLDFDDPYQTIKAEYIESAWWAVQRAEERGLLERGHRVVNWCPRCETAIADSEVEYWDETDPSIFVKFPVTGRENEYLVIWTTTPWTLPANVAVAVSPAFTYARVAAKKDGSEEILWIADELVESVLKMGRYQDYTVLERVNGSDLVGTEYESPLAGQVPHQAEIRHRVVAADYVALENTGLVHIAPGHGWDDYLIGIQEGLEAFCPVDAGGCFTREAGAFADMYVRDANDLVIDALGDYLLARRTITHRYGHCWRCKTSIIYRATAQWFLKATEIREPMLQEIAKVKWYPEWAGSARFHDFVRDSRDWCISRQRYWGIPIPIWQCEQCGERTVIGTIAELEERSGARVPDPHRPYVDEVVIPCSCGGEMHRVADIFDVWFDSAVASWATLGFPREREAFDRLWPADFITEGQDQTRGWFYSQLGASTVAFGRAPYKSVLMHGFALDADGRKMSKSFGNVVTPEEVMNQFGVDVLRFYVLWANAPWDDLKFNWDSVKTIHRTLNILWNVYRFPLPYMVLDSFEPAAGDGGLWDGSFVRGNINDMPEEDRWIISRVNSLARTTAGDMQEYHLHRVTRALAAFILEDLSRWYVQLVRPRMWLEEDSPEKRYAYETVYYVMRRLVALLAPFTPHIAEEIYGNLRLAGDPESVHMLDWPEADDLLIAPDLESAMEVVRSFDDAVATARQNGRRKLRWPVAETVVVTGSDGVKTALEDLNDLALNRANSRTVRVVTGRWDRILWQAEPVMRAIGPEFGKEGPKVKALIEGADGTALKAAIERDGKAELGGYEIAERHVTFAEALPEGVFAAPMKDATVYVDVTLTPALEAEGYAREVIRRIQEMRRQLDLNVDDFIVAAVDVADDRVASLIAEEEWQKEIAGEVRAAALTVRRTDGERPTETFALEKDWDVEGVQMQIGISRAGE
ncbi:MULTISPECIES: isoleucine--tRNA ligase [Methanoculleus]|uniref:Isoleucine--tRNA ligase n=2 Tax=Methanoculleus TaxID=45989 RepID=SYI_METMJ|nr:MULTISPECIES: isoleucine--tRNA ligase [Methanoculleus]A3CSI6.1 RecName: Full=Isoleucine--tRNA ligase; AltName: Full=Isoleucyl-tRNA synthetase; Short=IleRS [Methanoculleus marisnigri JR1]ABN56336.1 Isoleucyl-tRNA synthetase [Methanoculleus marisnigri JR1]MCC7556442.1 isoleucine--tRNA ligase [Methanoculleus marisnigri]UYU17784.1 isoleucine--tRNA ligase [Methanoculleus submarinus]